MIMQEITIVGGGLAGLVAAISVAEKGGSVTLEEARSRLGGRAHTARGAHKVNYGPHALYRHGTLEAWLLERDLLPPVVFPSATGVRLLDRGKLKRLPLPLLPMRRLSGKQAPVDRSFRDWATELIGERGAEAAIGFASLPTFHADPGTLSAAFVHERIQRSIVWRPVYYVCGGWQRLVERLEMRAHELGVRVVTGQPRTTLPEGPVIVATDLESASNLLDDPSISWPRTSTAIYDIALETRRGDAPAVLSLDHRAYASNYAHGDASVAGAGESLVQASIGLRSGEQGEAAWSRIEALFDAGWPGWRERVTWRRKAVCENAAGPADAPGQSWRDRPAIDRGEGRWLVGDCVAAPGVLSEVSCESAIRAAAMAVEKVLGARA
jgi:glycine/D-amino acid oxidase-like deaminating enzyme